MLADEEILEFMKEFILDNAIADKKKYYKTKSGFIIDNGEREIHLITSVDRKTAPALERVIGNNSSKGIATGMLFPKTVNNLYEGGLYDQRLKALKDFEGKWHHYQNMSTAEGLFADIFNAPLFYFNKHQNINDIEAFRFQKIGDINIISELMDIEPFGSYNYDEDLNDLRNESRGVKQAENEVRRLPNFMRVRFREIHDMYEVLEDNRFREVTSDYRFSKARKKQRAEYQHKLLGFTVKKTGEGMIYAAFCPVYKQIEPVVEPEKPASEPEKKSMEQMSFLLK